MTTSHSEPSRWVIDLGSHSAKLYILEESIRQVSSLSWSLLEVDNPHQVALSGIKDLLDCPGISREGVFAFGTEAFRRSRSLRTSMRAACKGLGVRFKVLSQPEEASLIRAAFFDEKNLNIVNVGGGSIQIIDPSGEMTLLPFGISDLNRRFALNEEPYLRRVDACIEWVSAQLPEMTSEFIYTGGEKTYLLHFGVPLENGVCSRPEFERLAARLSNLPLCDLEQLSPLDPGWMRGAVASNCIVLALLAVSDGQNFVPSDFNVVHGLLRGLGSLDGAIDHGHV